MFNHILVPLDGSSLAELVLPHVIILARASGAKVTLLHVVEHPSAPVQGRPIDPLSWRFRQIEATTYLDKVSERLEADWKTPVEKVTLEGQAAERITEFAHDHQVDLIALTSHGYSGLSSWNVSSVVQKIISRAYTSFFVVRAYHAEADNLKYQRVLVPLDGSQRAECVLPLLTTLSQQPQAHFELVHVVQQPEMPRRTPLLPEENELATRLVTINTREATKYLDRLKSRLPGEIKTRVIVSESVPTALQTLTENESIDLILLSAHGYSGNKKHPYGSVGLSFIAHGTTPLLIIQDLPQQEIELTEAEIAALHEGNGNGGRSIVYDKPSV